MVRYLLVLLLVLVTFIYDADGNPISSSIVSYIRNFNLGFLWPRAFSSCTSASSTNDSSFRERWASIGRLEKVHPRSRQRWKSEEAVEFFCVSVQGDHDSTNYKMGSSHRHDDPDEPSPSAPSHSIVSNMPNINVKLKPIMNFKLKQQIPVLGTKLTIGLDYLSKLKRWRGYCSVQDNLVNGRFSIRGAEVSWAKSWDLFSVLGLRPTLPQHQLLLQQQRQPSWAHSPSDSPSLSTASPTKEMMIATTAIETATARGKVGAGFGLEPLILNQAVKTIERKDRYTGVNTSFGQAVAQAVSNLEAVADSRAAVEGEEKPPSPVRSQMMVTTPDDGGRARLKVRLGINLQSLQAYCKLRFRGAAVGDINTRYYDDGEGVSDDEGISSSSSSSYLSLGADPSTLIGGGSRAALEEPRGGVTCVGRFPLLPPRLFKHLFTPAAAAATAAAAPPYVAAAATPYVADPYKLPGGTCSLPSSSSSKSFFSSFGALVEYSVRLSSSSHSHRNSHSRSHDHHHGHSHKNGISTKQPPPQPHSLDVSLEELNFCLEIDHCCRKK